MCHCPVTHWLDNTVKGMLDFSCNSAYECVVFISDGRQRNRGPVLFMSQPDPWDRAVVLKKERLKNNTEDTGHRPTLDNTCCPFGVVGQSKWKEWKDTNSASNSGHIFLHCYYCF